MVNYKHRERFAEADARLIASAPDLLAACEAALLLMPTGEYTPNQEAKQESLRVRSMLRAAIAKAKGGAD